MHQVEVVGTSTICRNFPDILQPEISHEHFLRDIDKAFDSGIQLIVIEGPDGYGKTTLLAQYARFHSDQAISVFINPASRITYSPDYLITILAEQIYWTISKKYLEAQHVDISLLNGLLTKLEKRSIVTKKPYYFIIDGLEEIPQEESHIRGVILHDLLPLGSKAFKFILSGDLKNLSQHIHKSIIYKGLVKTLV